MAVTIKRIQQYSQTHNNAWAGFFVDFGEPVTGVSPDDFTLLGTGTAGAPTVTPSNGGYDVVFTPTSDGTFGLQLNSSTDIRTDPGNAAVAGVSMEAGDWWTVDRAAPTITSVSVPADSTYRFGEPLDFTVNFSEAVSVFSGTPNLAVTLSTGGTILLPLVDGNGTSSLTFRYIVGAGQQDANGVVLAATLTNGVLRDAAGNAAGLSLNNVGSTTGVLVNAAPYVKSIVRNHADNTNAAAVAYTVTFDQAVTGVDAGDFSLTSTGSAAGVIASVTGSGATYTVNADQVSGDGRLRLDFNSSGTGVVGGGLASTGFTTGEYYTLDHTPPAVSFVLVPSNATYVAGQNLDFTVTFSEVVDVVGGAPSLGLTVGSVGRSAALLSSSGQTASFRYEVQAGDLDTDGVTVGSLTLNGATVRDAAGNDASLSLNSIGSMSGVKVDAQAPTTTVASVTFSNDTGSSPSDFITKTATQTVSGALSQALASGERVEVSFNNGASWSNATAAGDQWSVTTTLTGSNTLQVRVIDGAGNAGSIYSQAWTLDTTAPTVTASSVRLSDDTGATATDFITKTASQTLTGTLSSTLSVGEFVQVSLDNGQTWATAANSGTTWTLAGTTLLSSSTLVVRVSDAAGNVGGALTQAFVLDTTPPSVTAASASFSSDTGASATDLITKTPAQAVSGTLSTNLASGEAVEVSIDNGASWLTASATAGSNAWSLSGATLTQSDTLLVRVSDIAGNMGAAYSMAYVFDTQSPTVTITSSASGLQAGQSATLTFTFNETPDGFTSADILATGGVLGALAATANPRVFEATFVANTASSSVSIASGGYKDLAGNDGAGHSLNLIWTPPPQSQPDPEPTLTAPQIRDIFASAAGFAPNSSKALTSNITLPDGAVVPNPAFEAAVQLARLIARFEAGAVSREALIEGVVELSAPTSAVALQAYQFFTGLTPTQSGMAWLIDSPANSNDLTDTYYARFNEVNRFINFAVNLGVQGEGRAAFEAKFASLDFAASVRLAYDMVIGLDAARAAGIKVDEALAWITGQEAYFDAFAGSDLGGKAAMVGYIMQAGFESRVGRYYGATHDFIEAGFDGTAPYHVDLVGGQHLG